MGYILAAFRFLCMLIMRHLPQLPYVYATQDHAHASVKQVHCYLLFRRRYCPADCPADRSAGQSDLFDMSNKSAVRRTVRHIMLIYLPVRMLPVNKMLIYCAGEAISFL